ALDSGKTAVHALQLGAADYLVKGFELDELRQRVANLLKLAMLEKENNALRRRMATEGQFGQMIGRSAEMRRAFEMADRVAPTDSTVLILGESGTGKDLLAQEIHARSPRAGKPYVAVNCAALPETLIESELFGYERGAFTGAAQQKKRQVRAGNGRNDFSGRNWRHEPCDAGQSAARTRKPDHRAAGRDTFDSRGRAGDQRDAPQPPGRDSKWKISRRLVLPAARGNPRAASLARAQGRHGPAGRDLSPNARRKGGANPTPEPQGAGRHREIRLAGQCARIEECLGA